MDNLLLTAGPAPESTRPAAAEAGTCWHIITCEYPPQSGGVSDYTYQVAKGLADLSDEVHVWCPTVPGERPSLPGVTVHAAGKFSPADLRTMNRELEQFPKPRRLLVQWVPHGFGYKALNLFFCMWLWSRSGRIGETIELMVHEPFLPFRRGRWRQNAAALVQRLMTIILLRAAQRIWLSTPAWERKLRPFEIDHNRSYAWLPVPSNVPQAEDPEAVFEIRRRYGNGRLLIGHFGTFGAPITQMLDAIVPLVLRSAKQPSLLLMGGGAEAFREHLVQSYPELQGVIHATGHIQESERLSLHLRACDLMIQPYPEGITTRRGSAMAALSNGRPLVTTAGVLTEPIWEPSSAVELAPAGNIQAFVDAILRVLNDGDHRCSLGKAGRELYDRQFDVRRTITLLRARQ